MSARSEVAVIGGGVAGVAAAYLLSRRHHVTLFERNAYVGGHTLTVTVSDGPDAGTPVDMGFIVLNDRTYPLLHSLLSEWGVKWRWADMSFGYWDEASGLMYAGKDFDSLFAQRRNLLRPSYWRLLADIVRFGNRARADLRAGSFGQRTLGRWLEDGGFGPDLARHYVVPMGSAIWSAPLGELLDFPAELFARFFDNHGLLDLRDRPRWQTIPGGSHSYVKAFLKLFPGDVFTESPVASLRRKPASAVVRLADGRERRFDAAVVAAHADEALALLADPTPEERRLLGAWRYHPNRVVLHDDASVLPPERRAWASWNYRRPACPSAGATLTYDMTHLQGLKTRGRWCVTLNEDRDLRGTVRSLSLHHPAFTFESARTQPALASLNGIRRTWFCGSYFGYGFHEDAVRSAFAAAESLEKSDLGVPA
ncbi:MAG: FAD-dependent oxidoreductase [Elusimicrobia bacterium]|nr:FAD-dependent oxidoreductase [Elusimicrobiota bacterium]